MRKWVKRKGIIINLYKVSYFEMESDNQIKFNYDNDYVLFVYEYTEEDVEKCKLDFDRIINFLSEETLILLDLDLEYLGTR